VRRQYRRQAGRRPAQEAHAMAVIMKLADIYRELFRRHPDAVAETNLDIMFCVLSGEPDLAAAAKALLVRGQDDHDTLNAARKQAAGG
jgi:hypothetical protein